MYGTLISSVTVGAGGASSISFSSIPGTYTDLVLVYSIRGTTSYNQDVLTITLNGATTTFGYMALQGNGASASRQTSANSNWLTYAPDAADTANTFGNGITYIPNYAGSTAKSFASDAVTESNATNAYQRISAHSWNGTSAITSITIASSYATNLAQYSTAYLYGLTKGSGGASVS